MAPIHYLPVRCDAVGAITGQSISIARCAMEADPGIGIIIWNVPAARAVWMVRKELLVKFS